MAKSKIAWTDATWNPVTGCTKVSAGCMNCYAEVMARRLKAMGQPKYEDGFKTTLHPDVLEQPLHWRRSMLIFVCSMSDLFHQDVPDEFIKQVFDVMRTAHWHQFQVLTKRAGRLARLSHELDWPPHIWAGVTVENLDNIHRIKELRKTEAAVKFLSLEPLLGPIENLDLQGIDWAIVAGESGQKFRPMQEEWVRSIRDQCLDADVPFFFKQWGGRNKKKAGRVLDGRIWDEMPVVGVNETSK